MKHFGDITKIHGWEVPIVDVVTGGSPCQDLSVAGKRAGLEGERSGLFMDQVRIVKEMREHDVKTNGHLGVHVRPRYLVWENVTGALSSNNGEDFRVVLEEICKISDKDAVIPGPSGKWSNAGCIMGNGWSVAWRVHDAQYWGVPQRRKRICVLADFGGGTAGEILFELQRETADGSADKVIGYIRGESEPEVQSVCESVSGDSETCGQKGEEVAGDPLQSVDGAGLSFQERAGKPGGVKEYCCNTEGQAHYPPCQTSMSAPKASSWDGTQVCGTLTANNANGAQRMPDKDNFNAVVQETVGANCANVYIKNTHQDVAQGMYVVSHGGFMTNVAEGEVAHRLCATDHKDAQVVCYGISAYESNAMKSGNPHSGVYEASVPRTLDLNGGTPACNQGGVAIVEGVDNYNQTLTGELPHPLRSASADSDHVPCVLGQGSFGQYKEGFSTLKANGGDIGGGSETLVIQ